VVHDLLLDRSAVSPEIGTHEVPELLSGADSLLLLGRVGEFRSVNLLVLAHRLVEAESGAGLLDASEGLTSVDNLMALLFLLSLDVIAIFMLIMSVLLTGLLLLVPAVSVGLLRDFGLFLFIVAELLLLLLGYLDLFEIGLLLTAAIRLYCRLTGIIIGSSLVLLFILLLRALLGLLLIFLWCHLFFVV
jgi:hypothetical protein